MIAESLGSLLHNTTNQSFLREVLEDFFSQGEERKKVIANCMDLNHLPIQIHLLEFFSDC